MSNKTTANVKAFLITDVEATFIFRALLNSHNRIKEVIDMQAMRLDANPEENIFDYINKVADYQNEITSNLMNELTEQFNTDTLLMLPE